MTFNIGEFLSGAIKDGGARPSLFAVEFNPPPQFLQNSTIATIGSSGTIAGQQKSRLNCKAASLPESTLNYIPVGYFGRKIKVAGERTFQDWQTTLLVDENFVMRAILEAWSNGINRLEANVRDPLLDAEKYKVDAVVRQYSKTGTEIRAYQMIGAWPRDISNIMLDWDNGNAIEYFNCLWSYDYWLPLTELNTDGAPQYVTQASSNGNATSL
jgi:hypothetical protein